MSTPDSARPGGPPPQLQRVAVHAVASGLTLLLPLPLLDEVVLRRVRQHMVRAVLADHGLTAPERTVGVLAGAHLAEEGGRVERLARSAALAPVKLALKAAFKKAYRRAALALWVKDCVDTASASLHHGYLLQHALAQGHLHAGGLHSEAHARQVHDAIRAACGEVDPRPVNQLLRRVLAGSRLLRAELARARAREAAAVPAEEAASLAQRLAAALWEEQGYLQALALRFEQHLAAAPSAPAPRAA